MTLKLGRKYRINCAASKHDGRCGTLESVQGAEAWLMVSGKMARVPADSITDLNVVQVDMAQYRTRQELPLVWGDFEVLV